MMEFFAHPFIKMVTVCVIAVWPLMRLYRRVGLPQGYAFLVFTSLILPFSGFFFVLLPLMKPWPNFPKPAGAPKPVKMPI